VKHFLNVIQEAPKQPIAGDVGMKAVTVTDLTKVVSDMHCKPALWTTALSHTGVRL